MNRLSYASDDREAPGADLSRGADHALRPGDPAEAPSHPPARGSVHVLRPGAAVRILLVDDHKLFAEAIATVLGKSGMQIIGIAANAQEAFQAVRRHRPGLVLVDLGLPDLGGVEVGRKIIDEFPDTKVLALTALRDPRAVGDAVQAGFHGYLTKDTPTERFIDSIQAALGGQLVIPHQLARSSVGDRSPEQEHADLLASYLTPRELEVLALIVEAASSHEIARRLSVSPNTVRTHVQNILAKLQVHSRLEAATFAVRYGIVKPPGKNGA